MVDLGSLKLFLGMQVDRNRGERTMSMGQERYATKVLERCNMESCHGCKTPMDTKLVLTKPDKDDISGVLEYQPLVGSLMYAMLGTRPDLAYAVSTLSKFNSEPAEEHLATAKRTLRYLREQRTTAYSTMEKQTRKASRNRYVIRTRTEQEIPSQGNQPGDMCLYCATLPYRAKRRNGLLSRYRLRRPNTSHSLRRPRSTKGEGKPRPSITRTRLSDSGSRGETGMRTIARRKQTRTIGSLRRDCKR